MPSQSYLGKRFRICVLCNKLIDVNKNKFQEKKKIIWVYWEELLKSNFFWRIWFSLCPCGYFQIILVFTKRFFNIQQTKTKQVSLKPLFLVFLMHQIIRKIWHFFWSTTTKILPPKLPSNVYNTFFAERKKVWQKRV